MISRRAALASLAALPLAARAQSVSLIDVGTGPLVRRGVHYTGPVYIDGTREGILFEDCAFDWYVKVNEPGSHRIRDVEFRRCAFRSQPSHTWGQPLSGLQILGDTADVRVIDCRTVGEPRDWYGLLFYAIRAGEPDQIVIEGGSFTGSRAAIYAARIGSITVRGARLHDVASTDHGSIPVGGIAINHAREAVITDCSIRNCAHGITAYLYRDGHGWIASNDMRGQQLAYSLWGDGPQWLVEREAVPDRWQYEKETWSTA